jgi:hypothetical protein
MGFIAIAMFVLIWVVIIRVENRNNKKTPPCECGHTVDQHGRNGCLYQQEGICQCKIPKDKLK